MELLAFLIGLVALAVAWRLAAFILGVLAWVMVAFVALSLATGTPVPSTFIGAVVAMWLASQAVSRVRKGQWRSAGLRAVVGR